MGKASPTGGVKPMTIAGRYEDERERLAGMTDAERAFRKQWLKDQELSPNEPVEVPALYKELYNPIRRFYRKPLDMVADAIRPAIGEPKTTYFRYFSGKFFLGIAGIYIAAYYFKYNQNDWTRIGGWKVIQSKMAVLPGDPGYPALPDRHEGADYASRGFKDSKLNL